MSEITNRQRAEIFLELAEGLGEEQHLIADDLRYLARDILEDEKKKAVIDLTQTVWPDTAHSLIYWPVFYDAKGRQVGTGDHVEIIKEGD